MINKLHRKLFIITCKVSIRNGVPLELSENWTYARRDSCIFSQLPWQYLLTFIYQYITPLETNRYYVQKIVSSKNHWCLYVLSVIGIVWNFLQTKKIKLHFSKDRFRRRSLAHDFKTDFSYLPYLPLPLAPPNNNNLQTLG